MALIDFNNRIFKTFMARLYGWGASIVILGAMFKILHLPLADIMLVVGLTTESIIFFFSAFEKPVEEYDWTLAYPELAGMENPEESSRSKGLSSTQELDNMLKEAEIDNELIESLGVGLKKFGDAATKLNETVDSATATQEYGQQLSLAAKNMESLNAIYALQMESSANHVETQNNLMEKLNSSMQDSEKLSAEVSNLVQNINQLNSIYGGMLSAMNIK